MASAIEAGARQGAPSKKGALLSIFLLAGCCAASVWMYLQTMSILDEHSAYRMPPSGPPDRVIQNEMNDIDKTSKEYSNLVRATASVMQTALLAEVSSKNPVGTEAALLASRLPASVAVELPPELEVDPPTVTVVAVMLAGKDRKDTIAMINILGEETGLVIKVGSKFSNGEATVTKIDEKGVTYRWMGKSYTAGI